MTAPKPERQWKQIVRCLNEEESYRFFERIGILCEDREPDAVQAAWALSDVRRWQAEQKGAK